MDRDQNEEELSHAFTRELEEGMKRLVEGNRDGSSIDSMEDEQQQQQQKKKKKQVGAV